MRDAVGEFLQMHKNQALFKIILQELLVSDKVREEQALIWQLVYPKLLAVKSRLEADPRVTPHLDLAQLIRIFVGSVLAYFGQLYVLEQETELAKTDLVILENQILAGLWK